MIECIVRSKRYVADHGWLQSDHHFSFADYYDPNNMTFGALRVFNDDWVAPNRGFGSHPHRDMEIVSIVLEGELQHQDSTGRKEIIRPGEVQYMCAGTGIVHSEINPSNDHAVNFLQLWFLPTQKGLPPLYTQKSYPQALLVDEWVQVLAPFSEHQVKDHVIQVHQDVKLYLTQLEPGQQRSFAVSEHRRQYLYVIEGSIQLNEVHHLAKRDVARITEEQQIHIVSRDKTFILLIDLA